MFTFVLETPLDASVIYWYDLSSTDPNFLKNVIETDKLNGRLVENGKVQCIQKYGSDYLNLVIFGDFQNNFRRKNRNFQNCLAGSPFGLVLLGNFESFDFFAENYSENLLK